MQYIEYTRCHVTLNFVFSTVNAQNRLHEIPIDDVIDTLITNKLMGDSVVHLGVELGLSFNSIKETLINKQSDLYDRFYDLLMKWKNGNEPNTVTPSIYRLMVALKRVEAAEGLQYVMKTYDVEENYEVSGVSL